MQKTKRGEVEIGSQRWKGIPKRKGRTQEGRERSGCRLKAKVSQ